MEPASPRHASGKTSRDIDVTVSIPLFNAEEYLREVIDAVLGQQTGRQFELLLVDSGSTDATLDIVKSYQQQDDRIRLIQIPNSEFGHGKTRNFIVKQAKGEFVLFLTQDATPAHPKWLDEMVSPFELNGRVAAVFGKQIPRPDCIPATKRDMISVFNGFGQDGCMSLHYKDELVAGMGFPEPVEFLSDANSAVRRRVIARDVPFRDVAYAEDQYLGHDVIAAGFAKAYVPYGSVYHSHSYPLKKYFYRMVDEYTALKQMHPGTRMVSAKELVVGGIKATWLDIAFILRDPAYSLKRKVKYLALAWPYNLARRLAGWLADSKRAGQVHARLSLEAKAKQQNAAAPANVAETSYAE